MEEVREEIKDELLEEESRTLVLPRLENGQVTTPLEALSWSLNHSGRVDLEAMSQRSGLSIQELIMALRGWAIFQDAAAFEDKAYSLTKHWLFAPAYLSGNLKARLDAAQEMETRVEGAFDVNIKALTKRLPEQPRIQDIYFSLGATWIPAGIYEEFFYKLLAPFEKPIVDYSEVLQQYRITWNEPSWMLNNLSYGDIAMPAVKIIDHLMNGRTINVKKQTYVLNENGNYVERSVLDKTRTQMARDKAEAIEQAFQNYILTNLSRRQELERCYNERFSNFHLEPLDVSFLELPDLNPEVHLYPHQLDAIGRILLLPNNVLLAHEVGTGKTYEMIVAAHELKRMGQAKKPMIVVPNSVLQDAVAAHHLLYPQDNILEVSPASFTPKKRPEMLKRMREEDYTAIYIAYSSFDLIKLSPEYWYQQKRELVNALEEEMRKKRSRERGRYQTQIDRLLRAMSSSSDAVRKPGQLFFDELGVDVLFVDEAHNYKNVPLTVRSEGVTGLNAKGSAKARELLHKTRTVKQVIFSTGTPLTNSLADLYVMQNYLQPQMLKEAGLDSFDAWITTFAHRITGFEVDVDAVNLRSVTRFATFYNLPELMSMFRQVCDFHYKEEDDELLPDYHGYTTVEGEKTQTQEEIVENIVARTERIRSKEVTRKEDNLLSVTVDGRLAALDPRLLDPDLADKDEIPKLRVSLAAEKIFELYEQYPGTAQIVFSDLGTPKKGFNLYDELKRLLIEKGVNKEEIAFIHDADKEAKRTKLFKDVNDGRVRVVIGSTPKLGTGVNVQEKLIAAHHLSIPWRPADMVQREGRILRQGNTCEEVFIYRYVTKGTFDAYSWQILENKQRFIASFLEGSEKDRSAEDIADSVLSYAEVKALAIGNPLIKTRIETASQLEKLRVSSVQRAKLLESLQDELRRIPARLEKQERNRDLVAKDLERFKSNRKTISRADREELARSLKAKIISKWRWVGDRMIKIGEYRGFSIFINPSDPEDVIYLGHKGKMMYRHSINIDGPMLGMTQSFDYLLGTLPKKLKQCEQRIEALHEDEARAKEELEAGNPLEEKVKALEERLKEIDKQMNQQLNAQERKQVREADEEESWRVDPDLFVDEFPSRRRYW